MEEVARSSRLKSTASCAWRYAFIEVGALTGHHLRRAGSRRHHQCVAALPWAVQRLPAGRSLLEQQKEHSDAPQDMPLKSVSCRHRLRMQFPPIRRARTRERTQPKRPGPRMRELLQQLPFDDTSDFDDAKRGLIAPLPSEMIQGQGGNPIWNPQKYGFITEGARGARHGQPEPLAAVAAHQHQRPVRGDRRHLPGPQPGPLEHDDHRGHGGHHRRRSADLGGDGEGRHRPLLRSTAARSR